jgi:hypothetical protein
VAIETKVLAKFCCGTGSKVQWVVVEELMGKLTARNFALATRIAGLAMDIKGYGHIKHRNYENAKADEVKLLAQFRSGAESPAQKAAADVTCQRRSRTLGHVFHR